MYTDSNVWRDPDAFRPERWLEQPDAPLFTYGLGYRMCAGSLLANRELYLTYMRMLNSFERELGPNEFGDDVQALPSHLQAAE
jgi:cytochrome P450